MQPIGLLAAMSQESAALLRLLKSVERVAVGRYQGYRFVLAGKTCVLVISGMGMQRATEATQALLDAYHPQLLISFGIAGAVEANLQIGDVILAESSCRFDQGAVKTLVPLTIWPGAARKAISQDLSDRGRCLYIGTAVTTAGSQATKSQLGKVLHPVLEMETAGIARVAMENGVPLLSLRAISDGPCAPIPFDLSEVMDENANLHTGRLLRMVLRNPMILFYSMGMIHNTRLAAESAAVALLAALRHDIFESIYKSSSQLKNFNSPTDPING
jgi:adenosylhomocysteine nucleosidase